MSAYKGFSLKRLLRWLAAFAVGINIGFVYVRYQSSPLQNPKTAYDYYQLGKKLELEEEYDKAEAALAKALKMDPWFGRTYLMMGVLHNEKGNYAKAIEYFQQSLELLRGNDKANEAIAYYDLGHAYEQLGDAANAWIYFRKAYAMQSYMSKEQWPDNPEKNIYYVIHDDEQKFKERVGAPDELPEAIRLRISRYQNYKYEKILKDAQGYLADNPNSPYANEFRKYLVYGFLYQDRPQEALDQINQLNAAKLSDEDWTWLKYMRALAYKDLHKYDLAVNDLDELLYGDNRYYGRSELLYQKSLVFKEKGDRGAEEQILLQLVQKKGDDGYKYHAYPRLAEIYLYDGQYKKSFPYYFPKGIFPSLWPPLVVAIVMTGGILLVFFIIYRLFFDYKRVEIRSSPFRLRHLYLFMVVSSIVPLLLWQSFMAYDYYALDIFSRSQLNPYLMSLVLSDIIFIWLALYLLNKKCGLDQRALGFYSRGPKFNIALPVILTVCTLAVAWGYSFLLGHLGIKDIPQGYLKEIISNTLASKNIGQIIFLVIMSVVITPIAEEVVFRVFAVQYIRRYTNLWLAVILSSLLFAFGHGKLILLPLYFFVGSVLAITYVKTKTIYPSIIAHSLNNFLFICLNFWGKI